jgi:hypothetical protein
LSRVYASDKDRRHQRNGQTVRVIEYRLQGVTDAEPIYRLVTTLLDPAQAPAVELAALYHERWEIETALAELKTHLRGAKLVLRSKTPDLVRQEFYGGSAQTRRGPRYSPLGCANAFMNACWKKYCRNAWSPSAAGVIRAGSSVR